MTELIWQGKYDEHGRKVAPVRVALPFQTVETVNESAQERQRMLDMFSSGRDPAWRNRLIWGDKKYVLPTLLHDFAGQVDTIYIDPPFDTGDDFSVQVHVDDGDFTKQPSIIEQKAYRDTWGRGLESYLQWFYEAVGFLADLLAENGTLFVHLDYHVGHYGKAVLDEVFGRDNFRNEIILKRRITKNLQQQFDQIQALPQAHDVLLWYSKSPQTRYPMLVTAYETKKPEGYWHHFWSNADRPTMRYSLLGVTPKSGQWKWEQARALRAVANYQEFERTGNGASLTAYWEAAGSRLEFIRLNARTGKVENWFPPSESRVADTLWIDLHAYENEKDYPHQKHTDLLERVIDWTCPEHGLVLDCFCGSGTTAVVAERLNRRWIACDLSRFAIHTTRKRLLGLPELRPFVVQNLGKYERQAWQAAEFGEGGHKRLGAYRRFILELYGAMPVSGYVWLHGIKSGRMVHVGAVDSPVSPGDLSQIAAEFKKAIGTGKDAPTTNGVDVLGWDFAFDMNEGAKQQAAQANINVRLLRIPRDVMDKRAVEQGDIRFFELAALSVDINQQEREIHVSLTDFVIPPDDVPEDVQKAITHWEQWIDYWAVDWDYKGDTFHNQWQDYRTRKKRTLQRSAKYTYEEPGEYVIVVKVIDILGNDTSKTIKVRVGGNGAKKASAGRAARPARSTR
jgi:DNA modification methylase